MAETQNRETKAAEQSTAALQRPKKAHHSGVESAAIQRKKDPDSLPELALDVLDGVASSVLDLFAGVLRRLLQRRQGTLRIRPKLRQRSRRLDAHVHR